MKKSMLYDNERAALKYQVSALKNGEEMPESDIASMLRTAYLLLNSSAPEDYNLSLSAICHVAEMKDKSNRIKELLNECIVKSRVFLYRDMLNKSDGTPLPELSMYSDFAKDFYTSSASGTVFTKDQKKIIDTFREHPRVIVSAPTSFGKTRIIEELLLEHDYDNGVLIFPTVALLSEQYSKLKKSELGKKYTIAKSSRSNPSKKKNILILTPERLISFLDDNPDFRPDFFTMDEIYKSDVASDDERFKVFTYCLYRLARLCNKFYLIGPFFTNFSSGFCKRFDAKFLKFESEIVQKDFYTKEDLLAGKLAGSPIRVIQDESKTLARALNTLSDDRSLIYRYRKGAAESTALKLAQQKETKDVYNSELIGYISDTVSPDWGLIDCLKKGVAFHHGGIPRHIQEAIIQSFEDGYVEQIVCTTSLTEGVNTSAKSVFLVDSCLGIRGRKLKPFERKNIEGRSGRFNAHFTGNVIYMDDIPPDEDNDYKINLEYWESEDISSESLIQIEREDLKDKDRQEKEALLDKLAEYSIPELLIKKNRYISIEGQIALISKLRNTEAFQACFFSGTIPTNESLNAILALTYEHLFSDNDKKTKMYTEKQLIALTKYYIGNRPNIPALMYHPIISRSQNINTRVRDTFTFTSHYLEFAWPRYLKAFGNIYNMVAVEFNEPEINMEYLMMLLEYGTDKAHEAVLKDSGVPNDIIKKIGYLFSECETFEMLRGRAAEVDDRLRNSLSSFEYALLKDYL